LDPSLRRWASWSALRRKTYSDRGSYVLAQRFGERAANGSADPPRSKDIRVSPRRPRQKPSIVAVARHVRDPSVHVVRTADEAGVRQAVQHMVDLGHRKIVHVDGGRAPVAAERCRGYRTAMHRHGLAAHARIVPGGLTEESGAAARILLDTADSLPTTIVAFNDRCAVGLLGAFMRAASTYRRTSRSSGTTMITPLACRTSTSPPSDRTPPECRGLPSTSPSRVSTEATPVTGRRSSRHTCLFAVRPAGLRAALPTEPLPRRQRRGNRD
jgi:hypothetical protein